MIRKNRIIIFVGLVLVLCLGLAGSALALDPIPAAQGIECASTYVDDYDPGFSDVSSLGASTQEAIDCLAFYGITQGYSDGTYKPEAKVARWEMALFLSRLADYGMDTGAIEPPASILDPGFTDTAGLSEEAQDAIALLYTLGVTNGTTATTFAPYADVSRRDMASFLVRLQNLIEDGSYDTTMSFFSDVPSTMSRAADINALASKGIVVGYGNGTYGPYDPVLRSQMALFIMRMVSENVSSGRLSAAVLPIDGTPVALTVAAGEEHVVTMTTYAQHLTIGDGGSIVAPEGQEVTLVVNGVETGGKLVTTAGVDTKIMGPTEYAGNIILTISDENLVPYAMAGGPPGSPPPDPLMFPFRQALYLDDTGIVWNKSVEAAAGCFETQDSTLGDVEIASTGENFNGLFVAGGDWMVDNLNIDFSGNGRSDFIGYGAAVTARGETTTLVLNDAWIECDGVVRPAVVADAGSNVIVKNSHIQTHNGTMPTDYVPTIDTTQMRSVPWMLGLSGNNRATNLLGTHTKASYINSYVGAEGWGVLSTDGCTEPVLTAINSTIAITGDDGYGSYGIGNATENFLGCTLDVASYATISRGSFLYYGDSDPAWVAQLNADLGLGLSAAELAAIPDKPTVVNSDRWGIMWHGGGTLDVSGGTVFNTGNACFLDKGQAIAITVDGSEGAELNPADGVIFQLMDDDDPGPVPPAMTNTGVYMDPIGPVDPDPEHDVFASDATDALATFTDIDLEGDFYNSARGGISVGFMGPMSTSKNMALTFVDSTIEGLITASTAVHDIPAIGAADYRQIGVITNTVAEPVNNGVLVTLTGDSTWTVTGACYLTVLSLGADAMVAAPAGYEVQMSVNGIVTALVPGNTYTGIIELTLVPAGG